MAEKNKNKICSQVDLVNRFAYIQATVPESDQHFFIVCWNLLLQVTRI